MNELDELVYALEDLDLSDQKLKVLMNKGDTRAPQGKFEIGDGSKSIKEEILQQADSERKFAPKAKKNKDLMSQYHNNNKSK